MLKNMGQLPSEEELKVYLIHAYLFKLKNLCYVVKVNLKSVLIDFRPQQV